MEQELEFLEAKFRRFLNDTIIGASKDYYAKQKKYELRELSIIDDKWMNLINTAMAEKCLTKSF